MSRETARLERDTDNQRYLVHFDGGGTAEAEYRRDGDVIDLHRTFIPVERRGEGLGSVMMEAVMRAVAEDGLRVHPTCSYAVHYLSKHPEYNDLVVP